MNLELSLFSMMLVPFAAAGLALIHQGLGRSRSAAHAMLASLCALAVSAIVFVLLGSAWAGSAGAATHSFTLGGAHWDWLGAAPFFARGISFDGSDAAGLSRSLVLCLELLAVGLAATIPLSAGADRWRLGPICLSSIFMAGIIFPLFAHWAWGGGWLAQLAANFGISNFTDVGGAGVVQVVGGLTALSVAWIAGPRRGKYSDDGIPAAIPGHNIVQVLFGCLLALVGWIGLDSAASILFYGAGPQQVVGVVINALLSASAGCLAAVVVTRSRYHKPDASLSANGWIAGLVAGSAACAMVSPESAIAIGVIAGVLSTYLIEIFELHLRVDDPGGAVSVHALSGIWGLFALGLFGHFPDGTRGGHILAQVVGISALLGFMLPLVHAGNLLLNRWSTYRVDDDGHWHGMDVRELGAGAYPEFVIHADEFVPR
ncbi:MAG: ammonium transporter [Acidobacteriaceae bacterium]